ncbi:MAG TPA: lysophospholipid acyltransferase family protein [Chloroflexota bacterium]
MSSRPVVGRPPEDRPGPEPAPARPRAAREPVRSWALGWPARFSRAVLWPTLCEPIVRTFYSLEALGAERLAGTPAPVIFAANHCAHLDNAFIIVALPKPWRRRLAIAAAAADIFGPRHLGLPIKGTLAQLLGNAFPFARRRGPARVDHLQSLLDQRWSVLIFPEGKLTVCGPMQPFKAGIGLVAVESRMPVVPVRVDVLRRGPWEGGGRLSRGRVQVCFGAPMRFAEDEDPEDVTARLEAAVRAL